VKTNSASSGVGPAGQSLPQPVEQFTGSPLTRWGGGGLLRRFVAKLRVVERLSAVPVVWPGRRYAAVDYLRCLLMGLLVGLERQVELAALGADGVALLLLGLPAMPSQSSWSRFLAACRAPQAEAVRGVNRGLVRERRRGLRSATIDLDVQVISTRGHPEGASRGYNPGRRDSKSYAARMGFLGETRDILAARLRPGREATVSAAAAIQTYRDSRQALPRAVGRVRLRADAGFYSEALLKQLETEGVLYFVAVPGWSSLQRRVGGLTFRALDGKWAIADFRYRAVRSGVERRMVVIRERLDPTEPRKKQLKLLDCPGYAYQVLVTNSGWGPQDVWHFYNRRCCLENIIKESQSDFGGDHILSHRWGGNALWLALSVLAYNVLNWFRERVLGQRAHRHTARWLRRMLIELPGRLVHRGRQYELKLGRDHPSEALFGRALTRLEARVL